MGKMNLKAEDFAAIKSMEEPDIPKIPEPEEEGSLLDRLFNGEKPAKPEKVNRTYYLERDLVETIESVAKKNDISASQVLNKLLRDVLG